MIAINFSRLFNVILFIVKIGILLTITDNTALVLNTLLVVIEIFNLQINSYRCKCIYLIYTSSSFVSIDEFTKSMRTNLMRLHNIQFKFLNSFTFNTSMY